MILNAFVLFIYLTGNGTFIKRKIRWKVQEIKSEIQGYKNIIPHPPKRKNPNKTITTKEREYIDKPTRGESLSTPSLAKVHHTTWLAWYIQLDKIYMINDQWRTVLGQWYLHIGLKPRTSLPFNGPHSAIGRCVSCILKTSMPNSSTLLSLCLTKSDRIGKWDRLWMIKGCGLCHQDSKLISETPNSLKLNIHMMMKRIELNENENVHLFIFC